MLETPRLLLRPWQDSDAESLYQYASDPQVGPAAGWAPHTSVDESRQIIRTILAEPETYALVLRSTGQAIGSAGLMLPGYSNLGLGEGEAELGYWLGAPYWGQGLMPEAAQELIRYGFEELGLHTIWCAHFEGNIQSRRVQEKCGFVFHHTLPDTYWPAIDQHRAERVNCLTLAQWQQKRPR